MISVWIFFLETEHFFGFVSFSGADELGCDLRQQSET